jgi:ribosomal protein S18 acetylase RimI-like enzyme
MPNEARAPVRFRPLAGDSEVRAVLRLQAAMASQGFVTVRHDPEVLRRMSRIAPGIVAVADERVVGYALVMPRTFAADVPILAPLFATLETLSWKGVPLAGNPRWFVMGQVCVAGDYRGRGVVEGLYRAMAAHYHDRYDFTVTEVAARNTRSLRAHARVGFETLHVYPDETTGEQWHVIALDFPRLLYPESGA